MPRGSICSVGAEGCLWTIEEGIRRWSFSLALVATTPEPPYRATGSWWLPRTSAASPAQADDRGTASYCGQSLGIDARRRHIAHAQRGAGSDEGCGPACRNLSVRHHADVGERWREAIPFGCPSTPRCDLASTALSAPMKLAG